MKFTLVQVEMDSNDAGAVVRGLTEAMQGKAESRQPSAVSQPALIEAPKNGHVHKAKRIMPRQPKAAEQGKLSINECIRQAVASRPMNILEIVEYAKGRGLDLDSKQVSQAATYLRGQNEIVKFDSDLKWRPAKAVAAR